MSLMVRKFLGKLDRMLLSVVLTSGPSKTLSNPISNNNLGERGHTVSTAPKLTYSPVLHHGFRTLHHPRILVCQRQKEPQKFFLLTLPIFLSCNHAKEMIS